MSVIIMLPEHKQTLMSTTKLDSTSPLRNSTHYFRSNNVIICNLYCAQVCQDFMVLKIQRPHLTVG